MEINIQEIKGIDEFLKKIGELSVQKAINGSIKKSILTLHRLAIPETPVDIGKLRGSFTEKFSNLEGRLNVGAKYGIFVHEGTGIFARGGNGRKTPWVYTDEKGIFHRTVGQKPNPFMDRTFDKAEQKIEQIFRDDIENFLTDLTK